MDILGLMPLEVAQRVISLLEPEDVAKCMAVSKSWRNISNSDFIWREFCRPFLDTHANPPIERYNGGGEGDLCRWATIYISCHNKLKTNWQKNRYKSIVHEREGEWACAVSCDNDTVVVALCSGLIQVYQLPTLTPLQTLICPVSTRELLSVQVHSRHLVVTKANITLVYYTESSQDPNYVLQEVFALNDDGYFSLTRNFNGLEEWLSRVAILGSLLECRFLYRNGIWLVDRGRGVTVWDLKKSTIKILPGLYRNFLSFQGHVYTFFMSEVYKLTPVGEILEVYEVGGGEVRDLVVGKVGVVALADRGWRMAEGNWEPEMPPEGLLVLPPCGGILHCSPSPGAITISSFQPPAKQSQWTTTHFLSTHQTPTIVVLALILDRFIFCHFLVRRLSVYSLFNAKSGIHMYSSCMKYRFFHIDNRCMISLKVTMEGTSIHLRRYDHTATVVSTKKWN